MPTDESLLTTPIDDFTVPITADVPSLADPGRRFPARLIDSLIGVGLFLATLVPGFLLADITVRAAPPAR